MRIEELVAEMDADKIRVNEEYQRSGKIWPARAKSLLVETVLLRMPIPRVLLHVVGLPQQPEHIDHIDIIDGQQRCTILQEFLKNGFKLTADIDDPSNYDKSFSNLTPAQQNIFKDYPVPIDKYRGIGEGHIRHVFRRLNYYTAPLNAAEQRHAQFFGEFRGFVEGQSKGWRGTLQHLHTFAEKNFRRKTDQQLMAEVISAMLNGISTPNAASLRSVYKTYDRQFSSLPDFLRRLERARAQVEQWTWLRKNRVMRKHYHVFSFVMALMHAQEELASLRGDLGRRKAIQAEARVVAEMARLEKAIREKPAAGRYASFWNATKEKTNVRENRLTRCRHFYRALTG